MVKQLLKSSVTRLFGPEKLYSLFKIYYFGYSKRCSVCNSNVRRFLDAGYPHAILNELQIIGGIPRRRDECPVCRSNSRTRLVYFYLKNCTDFLNSSARILHLAPERGLMLHMVDNENYRCGDLDPQRYIALRPVEEMDITALPFEDGSFDLVICNHVLEHVPEDIAAMREIYRVLSEGGQAILQVPISQKLPSTREGIEANTDDDRIRLYGQKDHIRIYTQSDYVARLQSAGFEVGFFDAYQFDADKAFQLDIDPFEILFECHRN